MGKVRSLSLLTSSELLGIVNVFYGIGSGLGAPLGGIIVSRFDWRWAFLIQIPPLILAWFLVFFFVKYSLPGEVKGTKAALKQIDWLGCITLVVCISGFLLCLSFKNNQVWLVLRLAQSAGAKSC